MRVRVCTGFGGFVDSGAVVKVLEEVLKGLRNTIATAGKNKEVTMDWLTPTPKDYEALDTLLIVAGGAVITLIACAIAWL